MGAELRRGRKAEILPNARAVALHTLERLSGFETIDGLGQARFAGQVTMCSAFKALRVQGLPPTPFVHTQKAVLDEGNMESAPEYSASKIGKFVSSDLRAALGHDYFVFRRTGLARLVRNFAQLVILGGGRYGTTLRVMPTFYVIGAFPADEVVPQSVSLIRNQRWSFQNEPLDGGLAGTIATQLEADSPISFLEGVDGRSASTALAKFSDEDVTEHAAAYLGFYLMATGLGDARPWIARARRTFSRRNRALVHEWQATQDARLAELDTRIGSADCVETCRAETSAHAAALGFPAIVW